MYGPATIKSHEPRHGEIVRHEQTCVVELFMAGDCDHAMQVIRSFCRERPVCVTVTPQEFIYRGGQESGFCVSFRNYPRFPSSALALRQAAEEVGDRLREALAQDSYMVVEANGVTTWRSLRDA